MSPLSWEQPARKDTLLKYVTKQLLAKADNAMKVSQSVNSLSFVCFLSFLYFCGVMTTLLTCVRPWPRLKLSHWGAVNLFLKEYCSSIVMPHRTENVEMEAVNWQPHKRKTSSENNAANSLWCSVRVTSERRRQTDKHSDLLQYTWECSEKQKAAEGLKEPFNAELDPISTTGADDVHSSPVPFRNWQHTCNGPHTNCTKAYIWLLNQ